MTMTDNDSKDIVHRNLPSFVREVNIISRSPSSLLQNIITIFNEHDNQRMYVLHANSFVKMPHILAIWIAAEIILRVMFPFCCDGSHPFISGFLSH